MTSPSSHLAMSYLPPLPSPPSSSLHSLTLSLTHSPRALQTKVLHLEKDKRDLEQGLQLLRRSGERVEAESTSSKQKLTEQLHNYRKDVAKLKEVWHSFNTI